MRSNRLVDLPRPGRLLERNVTFNDSNVGGSKGTEEVWVSERSGTKVARAFWSRPFSFFFLEEGGSGSSHLEDDGREMS